MLFGFQSSIWIHKFHQLIKLDFEDHQTGLYSYGFLGLKPFFLLCEIYSLHNRRKMPKKVKNQVCMSEVIQVRNS